MQRKHIAMYSSLLLTLMVVVLSAPLTAQKKDKEKKVDASASNLPAVIWRDPGDMASLDLLYGAGGKEQAPNPNGTYTFVEEDTAGTSPKFDVEDENGVKWRVKLGQEPQSETSATRFLWAAGYFVDEDYYLPELKVAGIAKLHRGADKISQDGTIHGARLERKMKDLKKEGTWDWFKNPFLDTREFNGLRVMMSLLNNWDLKEVNNSVYQIAGERRYVVSDVGATFGKTGNTVTRSKSESNGFADSKFIEKTNPDFIDFVLHSRPLFLAAINAPNYHERTRMEQITKHIPRADAKWLG